LFKEFDAARRQTFGSDSIGGSLKQAPAESIQNSTADELALTA